MSIRQQLLTELLPNLCTGISSNLLTPSHINEVLQIKLDTAMVISNILPFPLLRPLTVRKPPVRGNESSHFLSFKQPFHCHDPPAGSNAEMCSKRAKPNVSHSQLNS
ncbi:hypothetical protein CEXT_356351 [Caerostris extrusa]|uniref:Uncharacterized protein n=1 Tax=Caerostris extrusa TaxID=172846 RepID=A0AAV4RFP0_CAEEX|nr:hypothetical protein CEXT_356351 [Caerostris extrusa]